MTYRRETSYTQFCDDVDRIGEKLVKMALVLLAIGAAWFAFEFAKSRLDPVANHTRYCLAETAKLLPNVSTVDPRRRHAINDCWRRFKG